MPAQGPKRELPSSGLMSASASYGHAFALGYVREVPCADVASARMFSERPVVRADGEREGSALDKKGKKRIKALSF
jgi:hypothetical protein